MSRSVRAKPSRPLLSAKARGEIRRVRSLPILDQLDAWVDGTHLYNQIDGGAPKYIYRGWIRGAYATYQQDGSSIQVAIHDMGSSDNAKPIFDFDLPISRVQIDSLPNAVVDMGLPSAYAAQAYVGQYYIEVSIDDRSDVALDYVQRFVVALLKRRFTAPVAH